MVHDVSVARTVEEELSHDLAPAVNKLEENLKHSIFVISNKLRNDKEVIGRPFEIDKRKNKGKIKNESFDSEDNAQEVLNVDLLYTGFTFQC